MHDFHYFLYLGCLFTHMNIIIAGQPAQFLLFLNLSNTMVTSAFKALSGEYWIYEQLHP